MRINETGEDQLAPGVNHLRAFRRCDIAINPRDGFAFAENIRDIAFAGRYDFTVFDYETHNRFLIPQFPIQNLF